MTDQPKITNRKEWEAFIDQYKYSVDYEEFGSFFKNLVCFDPCERLFEMDKELGYTNQKGYVLPWKRVHNKLDPLDRPEPTPEPTPEQKKVD